MKSSDTNDKNDHHDDSKEDINNNKTNYSNDSLFCEDNSTNNTMEAKIVEDINVVHINDKVESTTENFKRTDENVVEEIKYSDTNDKNNRHDDSKEHINRAFKFGCTSSLLWLAEGDAKTEDIFQWQGS